MGLIFINGGFVPFVTLKPFVNQKTDANFIKGVTVDVTGKADGKVLTFNANTNKIEFQTPSDDTTIDGVDVDTSAKADGKVLVYNSEDELIEFQTPATGLPTQTGHNGEFLTTNGSTASWATVSGGSGDSFDQDLNTTDDVEFNTVATDSIQFPGEEATISFNGDENTIGFGTGIYTPGTVFAGGIKSCGGGADSFLNGMASITMADAGEETGPGTLNMRNGEILNASNINNLSGGEDGNIVPSSPSNLMLIGNGNTFSDETPTNAFGFGYNLSVDSDSLQVGIGSTNLAFSPGYGTIEVSGNLHLDAMYIGTLDEDHHNSITGGEGGTDIYLETTGNLVTQSDSVFIGNGNAGSGEKIMTVGFENSASRNGAYSILTYDFTATGIVDGDTAIFQAGNSELTNTYEFTNVVSSVEGSIVVRIGTTGYDATTTCTNFREIFNSVAGSEITITQNGPTNLTLTQAVGTAGNTSIGGNLNGGYFPAAFTGGDVSTGATAIAEFDTGGVIVQTDTIVITAASGTVYSFYFTNNGLNDIGIQVPIGGTYDADNTEAAFATARNNQTEDPVFNSDTDANQLRQLFQGTQGDAGVTGTLAGLVFESFFHGGEDPGTYMTAFGQNLTLTEDHTAMFGVNNAYIKADNSNKLKFTSDNVTLTATGRFEVSGPLGTSATTAPSSQEDNNKMFFWLRSDEDGVAPMVTTMDGNGTAVDNELLGGGGSGPFSSLTVTDGTNSIILDGSGRTTTLQDVSDNQPAIKVTGGLNPHIKIDDSANSGGSVKFQLTNDEQGEGGPLAPCGVVGTDSTYDLRFVTNNTDRIRINGTSGDVVVSSNIDAQSFSVDNSPGASGAVVGNVFAVSNGIITEIDSKVNWDIEGIDVYVATTGDNSTGDGTSGAPYLTVARAMQDLPTVVRFANTIHVADGTYNEAINFRGFKSIYGGSIIVVGNTTTPANVVFTGTTTGLGTEWDHPLPGTATFGCIAAGDVKAEIRGLTVSVAADYGVGIQNDAYMIIDRCTITSTINGLDVGVLVSYNSDCEFRGNVTVENFIDDGVLAIVGSRIKQTTAGTLTITRPDSFGIGMHIFAHSSYINYTPSTNIVIFGCKIGWQLGLNALFQHRGATSTLQATNTNTPSSSAGVQCTDLSSWSTNNPLTLDHFTNGFEANSVSYIEATGSRSLSNIGGPSPSQNSVIYLP